MGTFRNLNKGVFRRPGSAFFLGLAPVFGRQAIFAGHSVRGRGRSPHAFAALLLLVLMLCSSRRYLYIYPAGLLGCLLGRLDQWARLPVLLLSPSAGSTRAWASRFTPSTRFSWPLAFARPSKPSRLTLLRLGLVLPACFCSCKAQSGADRSCRGGRDAGRGPAVRAAPADSTSACSMICPRSDSHALHFAGNERGRHAGFPVFRRRIGGFVSRSLQPVPLICTRSSAPLLGLTLVTFFSRLDALHRRQAPGRDADRLAGL